MCQTKICTTCLIEKSIDEFHNSVKGKFGRKSQCKICISQKIKVKPISDKKGFKICYKCRLELPNDNFENRAHTKDKLANNCKKCVKNYREENKESFKINASNSYQNNKHKHVESKSLWGKEYYYKNKDSIKKRRLKNAVKIKETRKKYYEKNKNSIKEKTKINQSNRIKNDSLFKVSHNTRTLIKNTFDRFKNNKFKKSAKTVSILGCSFNIFNNYLESQFESWMSWDNYGNTCETLKYNCSWDLDHIIPISYAKTEEEVYLLNHWSNFQPLCSKVNRDIKRASVYPCTNLELRITFWEDYYEYV